MTSLARSLASRRDWRVIAFTWASLGASCSCQQREIDREGSASQKLEVGRSTTADGPATGPVIEDQDFRLSVGKPELCEDTAPFLPEPGYVRLSIPVEVTAKGRRWIPLSPLAFRLSDQKDHDYGPTLAGCRDVLKNRRLSAGDSARGEVAFDVPEKAENLELTFDPFLIGRPDVRARARVPSLERQEQTARTSASPAARD